MSVIVVDNKIIQMPHNLIIRRANMSQKTREYAKELVSKMSIEEKMGQMLYQSPAIERLGIPAYNWWN